jgi:transposase
MTTHTTIAAGIDVSKEKLDVAIGADRFSTANSASGHAHIADALAAAGVARVGLEASGGYEAPVARFLRKRGFEVLLFEPGQVHGYRRFRGKRAKTDPIDAALIAAVAALADPKPLAHDERLDPLAERLTFIEQLRDDIAGLKTRRDRFETPDLKRQLEAEIVRVRKRRDRELKKLIAAIRLSDDLARRMDLLLSIPGLGDIGAVSLVVRMPELGRATREEAAALVGVAPYDDDSGKFAGARHIAGGRKRLRRAIYATAFCGAFHWNDELKALYARLTGAGKHHKVALVACMRKLVHIANAVLARGTPWTPQRPRAA